MLERRFLALATMLVAASVALPVQAIEVDELKSDLIGHTMGGREKCWKFRSVEHIKHLEIKSQSEDAKKRVCTIALELQAGSDTGKYAAEAKVDYVKVDGRWEIKGVGLLSLERIEE